MNKEDIIMIGAGYGSQPVVNNFKEFYNFKGYLDDDESLQNKIIEGFPVLGKLKTAKNYDALFIFGISDPYKMQNREKILKKTKLSLENFATLIHPNSYVCDNAKIGKGAIIYPTAYVGNKASIGNHVIIMPNSTINHDCIIKDYAVIASGAQLSGNVHIGKSGYVGSNSSIREYSQIGDLAIIGMGSVVLNNIGAKKIVAGNPAKVIANLNYTAKK